MICFLFCFFFSPSRLTLLCSAVLFVSGSGYLQYGERGWEIAGEISGEKNMKTTGTMTLALGLSVTLCFIFRAKWPFNFHLH